MALYAFYGVLCRLFKVFPFDEWGHTTTTQTKAHVPTQTGQEKQQLLVYVQSPNKQVTVLLFLQGQAYISIKTGLGTFTDAVGPSDFTFDRN